MGEIIIKIPSRKNRSYVFTDVDRAEELIDVLDKSAIRLKGNPANFTRKQLEDLDDLIDAEKAMDEYRRTGISYTVEELREKYGLV